MKAELEATVRANLAMLAQGERLLTRLDDTVYVRTVAAVPGGSIGAHIRHNLDHCRCLLAGLASGRVDYSARGRDPRTETDRRHALAELARLRQALADLRTSGALQVRRESDPDGGYATSSLARELDFLMSHGVHHYAIVAILCRLQGIDPEPDFGVAPSTLRYRASLESAATPSRVAGEEIAPCAP